MRDTLPHASFIGFTGTPIELTDKKTRAVFGDYISVYDIQRAVEDKATVPIYCESRLAKLELDEAEKPRIDPVFEEVTEGEEVERKERLKSKWAQLEAIVGSEKRLKLVARDIVDSTSRNGWRRWTARPWHHRLDRALVVFVCSSRRGLLRMCGCALANRFRDAKDPLRWHWEDGHRPTGSGGGDAGEVRDLRRPLPRLQLVEVSPPS